MFLVNYGIIIIYFLLSVVLKFIYCTLFSKNALCNNNAYLKSRYKILIIIMYINKKVIDFSLTEVNAMYKRWGCFQNHGNKNDDRK